jgi:co-chaperonin GroES (HSP10)
MNNSLEGIMDDFRQRIENAIADGCMPDTVVLRFDADYELTDEKFILDTTSGLALPRPKKVRNQATVVAVGPQTSEAGKIAAKIIRPGDKVFAYKSYGQAFDVEVEGSEPLTYYIYREFEIFFRFPRTDQEFNR